MNSPLKKYFIQKNYSSICKRYHHDETVYQGMGELKFWKYTW